MIARFVRALVFSVLALAAPAQADGWSVAETEHFRIYSPLSPALLKSRAAMLEDYRALLETITTRSAGKTSEPKLDIFLVNDIGGIRPLTGPTRGIAGVYMSGPSRIAAYADAGATGDQTTLLHEYAHHFMLGLDSATAYPKWYVEGFAEYFMTAQFQPERITFGDGNMNRAQWLFYADWLPLPAVLAGKLDWRDGEKVAMFYAQSWLLTHYLLRTPELTPKFEAYLKAVAAGQESVAAFQQHIDPDLSAFQRRLKVYFARKKLTTSVFPRSPRTPATVVVTPLSAAAEPMLLQLVNLEFGVPDKRQAEALQMVRSEAGRHPGDPLAERALALAEIRFGDRAAGIARLEALIAANPKDAALLRWRGEAALPPGKPQASTSAATPEQAKAARLWFARAFKADPNDWQTLYLYALLERPYQKALKPGTLDVLLLAHQLAPQVDEIGMAAAMALAHADRLPDAASKLAPIAYRPHNTDLTDAAEALLPVARSGDAAAFFLAYDTVQAEQRAAAEAAAAKAREPGNEKGKGKTKTDDDDDE